MKFLCVVPALLVTSTDAFTGIMPSCRLGVARQGGERPLARTHVRTRMTPTETNSDAKKAKGASGAANLKRWDPSAQQAFLKPAVHNKNPVRVAALLAAVGLAARGSLLVPGNLAKFIHVLSFSAWMGSSMWVTFVAGITMFRNLPRQAFGKLQSKLFPPYFQLHFSAIGTIFIIRGCPLRTRAGIALLVSLATTFLNLVLLEPKSTSIMLKRYKLEDDGKKDSEEYKELGKKFGPYHGASSFVNLATLIGAFVYAWDLASMLPAV